MSGNGTIDEMAMREAMGSAQGAVGPKETTRLPSGWIEIAHRRVPSKQVRVTLALDAEVAAFFREMGRGHQSRMNDVLRAFMLGVKGGWLPVVR